MRGRKDGFYWVKDRRSGEWTVAKWSSAQHWWTICFVAVDDPAYPCGTCSDYRFTEIGHLIEPPEEDKKVAANPQDL